MLCGIPVDATDDLPLDGAFPLGCSSFTQAFLTKLRRKLQLRLGALAAFVDALGPASPALHIAIQILRVNLQPSFVHVFRALPWDFSHEWAAHIQHDVHTRLSEQLCCPIAGPAAQLTLGMPLRYAGLRILNHQYEAALHYLNGALALNDSHSLSLGNSETWSLEVGRDVAFVERTFPYRC